MRLTITVLGTELVAVELGRPRQDEPSEMAYENRHSGDFQIGFTPPPPSAPLPSDVEAALPADPPGPAEPPLSEGAAAVAEIVPDEGLDYWLNIMLTAGTPPANLYLGLFTSQSASTVPAAGMVLATPSGITEAGYSGYARVAVPTSDWGATAAKTSWSQTGRGKTAAQKSFAAAGASYPTPINGFFVATASTGGVCVLASNFDDATAIASLGVGDVVKVTPTYTLLN